MEILCSIAEFMKAIKPGFTTVYNLIGTVVSVLLFYKTVYIVIGALCTRKFAPAKHFHKYGIVIAARNEKTVIGNLLDSISKQDYPSELFTVFVVADNCTDDGETARIARDHGAVVYERFDREHATKGFALQYLFNCIERDYGTQNFEGFFVFDADNLLKSDYISRMNDAFDSGEKIITSYRNSKNFDENWISASYAMHWLRSVRQSHRARSVFRLATNIQGTGFLFASEIVKDGWKYTSLTEDRALTADAVVQGYQISYNDAAEFYDEQPTDLKIALRQRVRWAKGHILAFGESGWGLLKNIFTYKGKNFRDTVRQRFASFDMFFLVLPRPLFIIAKKILKAIIFITAYTLTKHFWVWTALYFVYIFRYKAEAWVTEMLTAVYVFVFESKRIKKISFRDKVKYTLTWPLFDIIGKYSMYVALFKKVEWKPIPHGSKISIDDVTKPREAAVPAYLRKSEPNANIRFTAHCAFFAVSLAYSFFMIGYNAAIFAVFIAINLILLGSHALLETRPKTPRLLSLTLLFLTFIWNITICCEVLGSGAIQYLFSLRLLLNLAIYAAPFLIFYATSNSIKVSAIITSVFWLITSSANYFLTEMRGRPLFLSDIFSVGTALNVVNEYEFNITAFYVMSLLFVASLIVYMAITERARVKGYYKTRWFVRIPVNTVIVSLLIVGLASPAFLSAMGVTPYFWSHKVNGFPLNFVMDLQYSGMKAPDGYSDELINRANAQYASPDTKTINAYDTKARPNVIVIMDESYADLRIIGDFDTNIPVTPFMDSLYSDPSVISGYTFVSVFGGGTADSEYEFLTGDNMFMYSQGAVPYQTNFKGITYLPGIVSTFNAMGYRTVATHPYNSSGWNRPNVYNAMGFDEQEYIEDYKGARKLRAYVSDESDFDHLEYLYESNTDGDPLFIFNVTMQNHGGYTSHYHNFTQKVELKNTERDYPLAEQYLSLIHETDAALEGLITYFDSVNEPTIIVFFGDHQVQVEEEFYSELYGKSTDTLTEDEMMKKYMTRFFIWSNFDMNTPEGYAYMARLEESMRPAAAESADGDVTASDTTGSDDTAVTEPDGTKTGDIKVAPVQKNRYAEPIYRDEVQTDEETASDVADSDVTLSSGDAAQSDTAGSDTAQSDDKPTETFVTETHIREPQIVTNLSYLSGIMFEAAGFTQSAYQNYLRELRGRYPVITAFCAYDADGVYHSIEDVRDDLNTYCYMIYNHMFDRTGTVTEFFTTYGFDIKDSGIYRYAVLPDKWIDDRQKESGWLRAVKGKLDDFCE